MYSHQRGWSAHTHTQRCKKNSAQATAELHSAQAAVSLPLAERNTSQLGTTGPPRQGDHGDHMGKIGENSQMGHDGPSKAPRGDIGPALQRFAAQWYQWPHGWKRFARCAQPWKKSSIGGVSQGATPALEPSPPTVGSFFEVPMSLEADWFTGDIFSDPIVKSDSHLQTQLLIVPYWITGRIMPMYYIPYDLTVAQQLWFTRSPVTMNGAPFWLRKRLVSSPTSPTLEFSPLTTLGNSKNNWGDLEVPSWNSWHTVR